MGNKRQSEESIEQTLAAAYRGQPAPEPSEQWHQRVMQAVHMQRGVLSVMPVRVVESRVVWRAAIVAVAAAVVMAILGFWMMPSDARLAWQFQHEGVASAWLLQVGE